MAVIITFNSIQESKMRSMNNLNEHIGLFVLRIFIGLRLIYGVLDNVISWDKMLEFSTFLDANGFPVPTISAVISVYAQLICGLFILIGFKIRAASLIMVINFLIALFMVHINDTVEGMTPALAMLFGSACLFFTGAGKIAMLNV